MYYIVTVYKYKRDEIVQKCRSVKVWKYDSVKLSESKSVRIYKIIINETIKFSIYSQY